MSALCVWGRCPYAGNIAVHAVANDMLIEPTLGATQIDTMVAVKVVWRVIQPKVVVYGIALAHPLAWNGCARPTRLPSRRWS